MTTTRIGPAGSQTLDSPTAADLKAEGRLVVDFPGRKLAVYANASGQVVLRSWVDGEEHVEVIEPSEADPLCAALGHAAFEAFEVEQALMAEYRRWCRAEANSAGGRVVSIEQARSWRKP